MKVIESAWKEFEKSVVPADAGPVQRNAMQDAFNAGATMMFMHLAFTDGSEDECVAHMDDIHKEIMDIVAEAGARRGDGFAL